MDFDVVDVAPTNNVDIIVVIDFEIIIKGACFSTTWTLLY